MKKLLVILFLSICGFLFSQQIADTTFNPIIENPEYEIGKGPVVFIDEGHYNFHTKKGRFLAFAKLLERDGYIVEEYKGMFDKNSLAEGKILVISNALNKINEENWFLPTPSAFTKHEIETLRNWVNEGGNLFLIADHMPMAGAASELASVFGVQFTNGFALDTINGGPSMFSLKDNTLIESKITKGRNKSESVEEVVTFTGQAFRIPEKSTPIIVFNNNYTNILPDTAWVFHDKTTKYNIAGWSQGAYLEYGEGKVVIFGEAAMFTAQLAGREERRVGMNSEIAPQNYRLLLNIIHWLDGKL